jgi:cytidylate kinase
MTQRTRSESDLLEPPLHGNRGDVESVPVLEVPLGLSIAISRETGARGTSIARRLGKKLGWQVYTQELLEFLGANESARSHLLSDVPKNASAWADAQLERLHRENVLLPGAELGELPRLILTIAARGQVILVGRGAGYLLPRETTLHVRIVAPLKERIAYMMQSMRWTHVEADTQVRERDEKRRAFLLKYFNHRTDEIHAYDMVLNSFLLGEEISAEAIAVAVRGRERMTR